MENELFQKTFKYEPILKKRIMSYLQKRTRPMGTKVRDELLDRFAVIFDGCSCGSIQTTVVFAMFYNAISIVFDKVLVAIRPMGDKSRQNEVEHHNFLTIAVSVFGEDKSNTMTLTGDDTAASCACSRIFGYLIVGCHLHSFNFLEKDICLIIVLSNQKQIS